MWDLSRYAIYPIFRSFIELAYCKVDLVCFNPYFLWVFCLLYEEKCSFSDGFSLSLICSLFYFFFNETV